MSNYIQLKSNQNLSYKVYGVISKDNKDCFILWFDDHWGYARVENCVPVDLFMPEPKIREASSYSL